MTLLERWDESHTEAMQWTPDEIRRAIAIAQIVDEQYKDRHLHPLAKYTIERADELLRGEP